ncbi:MAG: nickel pincer cofactor biosynthesis protein LarC [Candidatus Saganbacteria bacterium]|nr:nickel pincer cofactor biosynthesis protein LarC [Candidatus Saganbacteria bacterium]
MKIAYFDAPTGLSGNMILGALLDAGISAKELSAELRKLETRSSKFEGNYKLEIRKTKKCGLSGMYFNVRTNGPKHERNLSGILRIINRSNLSRSVKALSSKIFDRLAEAEAKVHGLPVNKVHFHEVGAVDAIVDIVGACIGIKKLGIGKIYCSPLPNGKGRIVHAHGLLPNPAPAAAELLKGVPTCSAGINGELVTPTGAAIITTLADGFGDLPKLKVEAIGYGAGALDLPQPNLLRVFIGEAELPTEHDAILQIETNIDDMDPGLYDRAIAKLMKAGALDASVRPIRMKKRRAAAVLQIMCRPEDKDEILDALFTETTTIGARVYLVKREKLRRVVRGGKKISFLGDQVKRIKPGS